jgi:hypothetical protein
MEPEAATTQPRPAPISQAFVFFLIHTSKDGVNVLLLSR